MVILVHGLDEPGNIWDDLAPAILDAGFPVARFDYPNDQAIADSAARLASALTRLKAQGVARVDLVCHSMGGLVAREALTSPRFYGGDATGGLLRPSVRRLILVAVPNGGAPLAKLRIVTEMKERGARWLEDEDASLEDLVGSLGRDGRGQAGVDLMPGSEFLRDLNARPLARGVDITVIAGELSPAGEEDIEQVVDLPLARALLGSEGADWVSAQLNTLRTTVGDGAVPLDSALLGGVDDVVTLRANHRNLLREPPLGRRIRESMDTMTPREAPPAIEVILERLRREAEPTVGGGESEG
jgi:pimeloyl-ACP methyl ester carboxylesterase